MKYKAIIFDLDGTILNTILDMANACNHVLSKHGFKKRTVDEIKSFVGNGIKKTLSLCVPNDTPDEVVDMLYNEYNPYYNEHCDINTKAYEGITDLLINKKKEGVKLAVVSNKGDTAVRILCKKHFPGLFDVTIGERAGIRRKPYPDSLYACINELGINKKNVIYVGDSEVDIETAKNAGIPCISVTWGFRDKDFLISKGAVLLADHPSEISDILLN